MSEHELKPCPFCGGEAKLVDYGISWEYEVVQCLRCGARTRMFKPGILRGEKAIEAWDRRANDEAGKDVI